MAQLSYFRKPVSNLKPGTVYNFQFRWKYTDGTYGPWSNTKSVLTAGSSKATAPTKATGLTASAGAFSLSVFWEGTYENNDKFLGFKAINIYASSSNLGNKTTQSLKTITPSVLVASMNVDTVKNSATIGAEALKGALNLTSTSVYTTPIYLYYSAVNENDELYQENNTDTYYLINETGLFPAKANYIDLESGIISIENLTASTGQFLSYLRAGIRNIDGTGARVEISGSSQDQAPPTYYQDGTQRGGGVIKPGLTLYNTDGTIGFRAAPTGDVTFSGIVKTTTLENFTPLVSTHPGYIEIPKADSEIRFYPQSTQGTINAGKWGLIEVTETVNEKGDTGGGNAANISIRPPTYRTDGGYSRANIEIWETDEQYTGILVDADSVSIYPNDELTLASVNAPIILSPGTNSNVFIQNSSSATEPGVRNIRATTSAPADGTRADLDNLNAGNLGDLWLEY
jgi:hypothetical protein